MDSVKQVKSIAVIGAGSWGTSVAKAIAENNPHIPLRMWAYEKAVATGINNKNENSLFLPGVQLPKNITATNNLKDAVTGSDVVLIATPSKIINDITQKINKLIHPWTHIGYLSKGFCKIQNEILTISQAIEKNIPTAKNRVTAISGPSHAEEVSNYFHTCLNVGGRSEESRRVFNDLITNEYLQCRETEDILGVDVGGTLKNPAAIAAGMISVLPDCGDNLAGALMSEALKEMIQLGKIFSISAETIIDISGLGDLVATSLSDHSRNRRFGQDIGKQILKKGHTISFLDRIILRFRPEKVIERMSEKLHYLAEGAYAIEPLIELAERENVSIPVYRSLYEVLLNKKDPSLLIETIKNPDKFNELYFSTKIQISDRKRGLERVKGKVFKDIISESTVNKFIISENKKTTIHDRDEVMSSLKQFSSINSENGGSLLTKKEERIINSINKSTYDRSVTRLIDIYSADIPDHFNSIVKWFLVKTFRLMAFINFIIMKRGRLDVSGKLDSIRSISNSENIIYISTNETMYDFLFLVLAIHRKKLPFPRFFVHSEAVTGRWKRFIIKRMGGFVIDRSRMDNIVYRESICMYLSTMIEHGMSILYFPELETGNDGEYRGNEFFKTISDAIFTHNVEIVLVPIVVTFVKMPGEELHRQPYRKLLMNHVNIKFSSPIYLSDYTAQPHLIIGLPGLIKNIWENERPVLSHAILCRILMENNYHINHDSAEKKIKAVIRDNEFLVNKSARKILKEALQFLQKNGVVEVKDGIIQSDKSRDIEYYSSLIR